MPSCGPAFAVAASLALLLVSGTVHAAVLDATWDEPTTNVDGSQLTTLASYRLYVGIGVVACPGPSFVEVAAPNATPPASSTLGHRLTGLVAGTTYSVSITAVDATGNESDCFAPTPSAAARVSVSVSPSGAVDFGNVALGAIADRTLTIQNTSGGAVSGSVTVPSPFTVVSGSPFTLAAAASQTVTVRFTPSVVATATVNLTVTTADGDSIVRTVTGGKTVYQA